MVMLLSCPCSDESVCGVGRRYATELALSVTYGDTSPKGRGFCIPQCFLYLFGKLYVIMDLRSNSAHFIGKEVGTMNHIFAFMTSVAANVVSHFVCKWLDGWFKDRKH